jgi:hypothetical protein
MLSWVVFTVCFVGAGYTPQSDIGAVPGRLAPPDTIRVGLKDGDPNLVFGRIDAVGFDGAGAIFVLDGLSKNFRVLGPDGHWIATVGRSGWGPGEFLGPNDLAVGLDGKVVVMDPPNARALLFELNEGGVRDVEGIRVPFTARQVCFLDFGTVLALGFYQGANLHEFTVEGELLRSFGEAHPHRDRWVREVIGGDFLACEEDRLIVGTRLLPYVYAYSVSGRELWSIRLPDFHQVVVDVRSTGFGYLWPPSGYYDSVQSMVVLPSGRLLLQVVRQTREGATDPVRSYILNRETGEVEGQRSDWPLIAGLSPGGLIAEIVSEPYPMLLLYPPRLRGWDGLGR